ncbi:MAG: hypothetical protein EA412_12460 [Chitinophagaceae bacterium]|nr:MAG: hypothetical protein EA412_12460 [Chitinophagaceae bacterium]
MFSSCKTKNTAQTDDITQNNEEKVEMKDEISKMQEKLIGTWDWEYTVCCGRNPQTITPEMEGNTISLRFFENFTVLRVINGESKTITYDIHYSDIYPDRLFISFEDAQRPALIEIDEDKLLINYEYIDLQREYYIKRSN